MLNLLSVFQQVILEQISKLKLWIRYDDTHSHTQTHTDTSRHIYILIIFQNKFVINDLHKRLSCFISRLLYSSGLSPHILKPLYIKDQDFQLLPLTGWTWAWKPTASPRPSQRENTLLQLTDVPLLLCYTNCRKLMPHSEGCNL